MIKPVLSANTFADILLAWYDANKRTLPWRSDTTPYHVWLSEIMLQQTQVQTVIPYYERFTHKLPTINDLAKASQDELHKLWEGLGYYSRVDRLSEAAKILVAEYDGLLPESHEALLALPGIGPYTAGAIASIAFRERVAAVDGNVLRILSRLQAYDGPINIASSAKPLHNLAQRLVPAHRPGDFNQALMDLGATVCIPNGAPLCETCPFTHACLAKKKQLTGLLPIKKPKKPRSIEQHTIVVFCAKNKIKIYKRPARGLLAGLWEFMDIPETLTNEGLHDWLQQKALPSLKIEYLGASRHIFTHKEWHMEGWLVHLSSADLSDDGKWVSLDELNTTYALASAIGYYRNQLSYYLL